MKMREEFTCPLEVVHDILKGKWKTVILYQLNHFGRSSLSTLEKEIKGISQKMLLEQLKELMAYGLVEKQSFSGYPLRVEYFISEGRGKRMIKALEIMQEIGKEYLSDREHPQKSG